MKRLILKMCVVALLVVMSFSMTVPSTVAVAEAKVENVKYSVIGETVIKVDGWDALDSLLGAEIKAKHTSKKPLYGKAKDYTKKQSVRKNDIRFDQAIQALTGAAVALGCAPITGGLTFVEVGHVVVSLARIYNSKTKTLYYTKVQYGHKKMPGVYHKYVTTWYLDAKRTNKVKKQSVYFDGNM